ncbi:MAG: SMP-30/gluconolactonase/LRE family protein [Gammaproteobacteria bacterium]|nr:SMP-30/gluconolactonase/LRE family protein [Gammaproteobacteria bacterium]
MSIELTATVFARGLCFGEGPRWHAGHLYVSDMQAHHVLQFDSGGNPTQVLEVPACPSGLGWMPDGSLLVVSMEDRSLLRMKNGAASVHADLSSLAKGRCNDMVVDAFGRAWVGNFGFDLHAGEKPRPTELIRVDPDGSARIVASELVFPNGTVITPDSRTLIVGESFANRLTAFDITPEGGLDNRRVWAELADGAVPDGICLDFAGGIWIASPTTNECIRVEEGGKVTHRIATDRGAYACMLGGSGGNSLFVLTSRHSHPDKCRSERSAEVLIAAAPHAGAGWP